MVLLDNLASSNRFRVSTLSQRNVIIRLYLLSAVENSGESGEITTTNLLLGIWSEKESAGHKILSSLGFTDEKAEELAKSVSETC